MKFGLKLWSINTNLIDQAVHLIDEKVFDYIELMVIPDSEIKPFLIDVPYIIHIPHEKFGVNIGDPAAKEYTLQKINKSITWADRLNAKHLILHAGHGSMQHATDLLHGLSDSRVLIENMPKVGLDGEAMIGHSPEQIEELVGDSDMGLCLDFGHAVKAAVSLGVDYKEYVKRFVGLRPRVFHVSDGTLSGERDEHLGIGEGEYDFGFLMECVGSGTKLVTVETPRLNQNSLDDDTYNCKCIKTLIF
ncbi:MAG: sugar phosphate isomerase/epimerase [Candidatus Eremiobacteraeota bacterium]|nr:sugar phosphate isomerase/epimerase [Candidatus Eremiobacteraeota bacterium]